MSMKRKVLISFIINFTVDLFIDYMLVISNYYSLIVDDNLHL